MLMNTSENKLKTMSIMKLNAQSLKIFAFIKTYF